MFYLSNVAIAVNISQPSVRIGGGLHALIHIYFLHGGSKSSKPFCDLKRIEFEGWFVVANTQRPLINGLPNGVDGAVKTSAIATNERLVL